MIKDIDEAIQHCHEKAEEKKKEADKAEGLYIKNGCVKTTKEYISECLECASEHEQLAEWLEELKARREAAKKLEESAEYYKDSLFGDGICFALKVIDEPRKKDWESETENETDN